MLNPYAPSQELDGNSDSKGPLRFLVIRSVVSPNFLICFCVGLILGLQVCELFFQWLNEGQFRPGISIQRTTAKLTNPAFAFACFASSFLLTTLWKTLRQRWRDDYAPTSLSRIASGLLFVCVFYWIGNATNTVFRVMGFTQLLPVALAFAVATFVVVECEAIWVRLCVPSDDVDCEPPVPKVAASPSPRRV